MGLFDRSPRPEGANRYGKPKLPTGQTGTDKFPVLTYGDVPQIDPASWRLRVFGLVDEHEWTWDEFLQLPQTKLKADFHCVTHWSRFDDEWEGVLFRDLAARLRIQPVARHVLQHAYGGYTTNLPLPSEHGGPVRVFTPKRYAWKGAKWIHALEFLAQDKAGFWEQNGYSNTADPWKEERFR